MKIEEFRGLFGELSQQVYGRPLVYLDNAATSLRPVRVVDKLEEMSVNKNANVYRANHRKSLEATREIEDAREAVRGFIGAEYAEEIIFTSGTTASLNLLAYSFGEAFVREGDEIIVSEAEHHSDIVPWQLMCSRKGASVKVLPVGDSGSLEIEKLDGLIGEHTRLVCVAHVSNVIGLVNPIGEIIRIAHSKGVPVAIDGAQGILHETVDVKALDCDFYAFSGHKIYTSTGTGVLYGKKSLLDRMPPWQGGGEMISSVKWSGTSFAELPFKFEAGTPNVAAVPTFVPAIRTAMLARENGGFEEKAITGFLLDELGNDPSVLIYGLPSASERKVPIFSLTVKGVHHEDLSLLLDKMGVAVRSGQMCAEPLMDRYGVSGMLRASFGAYNTLQEAECFVESLRKAVNMLK